MPMPQIIPPSLTVVPLDDPAVERHGFGPNSVYVEFVYLPILGATTVWLYRRLGVLVLAADSTVVDLAELPRPRRRSHRGAGPLAPSTGAVRRGIVERRDLPRAPGPGADIGTAAAASAKPGQDRPPAGPTTTGFEQPQHARHGLTVGLDVLTADTAAVRHDSPLVDRIRSARPEEAGSRVIKAAANGPVEALAEV